MNDCTTEELAYQLADSAARSDIEVMCAAVTDDGREPDSLQEISTCWYDVSNVLIAEDWPAVNKALEYLQRRCMLEHCPDRYEWVRIKTRESGDGKDADIGFQARLDGGEWTDISPESKDSALANGYEVMAKKARG